jgi:hypothetical protein
MLFPFSFNAYNEDIDDNNNNDDDDDDDDDKNGNIFLKL